LRKIDYEILFAKDCLQKIDCEKLIFGKKKSHYECAPMSSAVISKIISAMNRVMSSAVINTILSANHA